VKDRIKKEKPTTYVLKAASSTSSKDLSTTIIGCLKDFGQCKIISVGAGAYYQAGKACILVKSRLAEKGINIYKEENFTEPRPVINGEEKTGMTINIYSSLQEEIETEEE
jgi:stage V sporulation protein SpoVS